MNIGQITFQALMRAGLSTSDYAIKEMAYQMLDEIIQSRWESKKWQFRKSKFYLSTGYNIEEYSLSKYCGGVPSILINTMRGSNPVRRIMYEPSTEHNRKRSYNPSTGDPYFYREGEYRGFEVQVSAASQITVTSSLANVSAGTANVVQGSQRVVLSGVALTLDMLGRWFRVGSDERRYKIISIIDLANNIFMIDSPYELASSATASYVIGDVQQKATIMGVNTNGNIVEEEIRLNGNALVVSVNTFAALIRCTKSDKTGGYVSFTSNGGIITNVTLDPGETESDFQTILFYPIPSKIELLSYESYASHPHLYRYNDSPLFPNQYHALLTLELFIKLQIEWNEKDVSQETLNSRDRMISEMESFDNNTDNWEVSQETESDTERSKIANLPTNYGVNDSIDY